VRDKKQAAMYWVLFCCAVRWEHHSH